MSKPRPALRHLLPLLTAIVLAATPLVARGQAAVAAAGGATESGSDNLSPWRGSYLWYSHNMSAVSLMPGALQTWNPMYMQQLTLRPSYHLHKQFFLVGQFTLGQEFTNSDATTYRNEVELNDTLLELFWKGWKEPNTGVMVAASLRAVLPTSKGSWAASLVAGIAPTLRLTKGFDVLGGLTVIAFTRGTRFAHLYSTSQVFSRAIPCADPDVPSCASFLHDGGRNTAWALTQGALAFLGLNDQWSLSLLGGASYAQLYALTPGLVPTQTGDVPVEQGNGVDARFSTFFSLGANYQLNDIFSFVFSAYTFSSTLGPDGRYRNPFINPQTTFSLEVDIELERAWATFSKPAKPPAPVATP